MGSSTGASEAIGRSCRGLLAELSSGRVSGKDRLCRERAGVRVCESEQVADCEVRLDQALVDLSG